MLLRGDKAGGRRQRGTFLHLGYGDKNITRMTVTPSPSLTPAGDPRHGGTRGVSAGCPLPLLPPAPGKCTLWLQRCAFKLSATGDSFFMRNEIKFPLLPHFHLNTGRLWMAIIYIRVRHPFLIPWDTVRRKIPIPPVHLSWIVSLSFF